MFTVHTQRIEELSATIQFITLLQTALATAEAGAKDPPSIVRRNRRLMQILNSIKEEAPGTRFDLEQIRSNYEATLKSWLEEEVDHG